MAGIDHKTFKSMMRSASWREEDFKLNDDMQVRMLGEDVAVVAYKVHEALTAEGTPVTLDAADSSTWVRRDGHWLRATHTETLSGAPCGRDRH